MVTRRFERPRLLSLLLLTSGCGGQILSVTVPKQDPNTQAHFICEPNEKKAFDCRSGQAFYSPNLEFDLKRPECEFGVARVWVEADWRGQIERVQFVCAKAPIDDLPED